MKGGEWVTAGIVGFFLVLFLIEEFTGWGRP